MRIGVDVGGTNTDAAILDGRVVHATAKRPTTADVTSGIVAALGAVLEDCPAARGAIDAIMIGTTHFTNAVVQRRDLVRTATIRIGLPATASVPTPSSTNLRRLSSTCGGWLAGLSIP